MKSERAKHERGRLLLEAIRRRQEDREAERGEEQRLSNEDEVRDARAVAVLAKFRSE